MVQAGQDGYLISFLVVEYVMVVCCGDDFWGEFGNMQLGIIRCDGGDIM